MNEDVYIIDAKRTAIGKYGGSLRETSATDLGITLVQALLAIHPKIKKHIDEVILGNVISAGLGQNPARIVAFKSGISQNVPALTINKVCGSSLKSVILAVQAIRNEDAQVIVAGGMENMSRVPFLLNSRFGAKVGHQQVLDAMIFDGLYCSLIGEHMGVTAENVAKKYSILREQQDNYALASHKKALLAIKNKRFHSEIVPIAIGSKKNASSFDTDEQPRIDTTKEALQKLSPAFKKNGTVTAGNASTLNDAASIAIVASSQFVKKHKLKPMAKIVSFSYIGLNPRFMGIGAYDAAVSCLKKAGLKVSDIDLWEINEAFASQTLAVMKLLNVDPKKVNVHGGAIALGHPIGASGARILTTLLYGLKRQSKRLGVATLCIGGGQGVAMLVENI